MKSILIILFISGFSIASTAQVDQLPDPKPYFVALIVSDIDRSISWYADNLGFELAGKMDNKDLGFRQANIKRGDALLELIELKSAVNPKKAIPGYDDKTKLLGIFKFGFAVADFDQWMVALKQRKVSMYGSVVMDPNSNKKMAILIDPDGNYVQLFEN